MVTTTTDIFPALLNRLIGV